MLRSVQAKVKFLRVVLKDSSEWLEDGTPRVILEFLLEGHSGDYPFAIKMEGVFNTINPHGKSCGVYPPTKREPTWAAYFYAQDELKAYTMFVTVCATMGIEIEQED